MMIEETLFHREGMKRFLFQREEGFTEREKRG